MSRQQRSPLSKSKAAENSSPLALSISTLAQAKKLPKDFLAGLGVVDCEAGVVIPYYNGDGTLTPRQRLRTAMDGESRFRWLGDSGAIIPYGVDRLDSARRAGNLTLVEGETDAWTLWFSEFPALGLPGANMAKSLDSSHVNGVAVLHVVREPGIAGGNFIRGIARRLMELSWTGEVREVRLDAKDASDLYIEAPDKFRSRFGAALAASTLFGKLDAGAPIWDDSRSWPTLHPAALHGLAGEFVHRLAPETEADPAALLLTFLVGVGNALGDGPHALVGSTRHPPRLNTVIVGQSAYARKGLSWDEVAAVLRAADENWFRGALVKGLSTGEGLIAKLSDPWFIRGCSFQSCFVARRRHYCTHSLGRHENSLCASRACTSRPGFGRARHCKYFNTRP